MGTADDESQEEQQAKDDSESNDCEQSKFLDIKEPEKVRWLLLNSKKANVKSWLKLIID